MSSIKFRSFDDGCHLNGFTYKSQSTTKAEMPLSKTVELHIKISVAATEYL